MSSFVRTHSLVLGRVDSRYTPPGSTQCTIRIECRRGVARTRGVAVRYSGRAARTVANGYINRQRRKIPGNGNRVCSSRKHARNTQSLSEHFTTGVRTSFEMSHRMIVEMLRWSRRQRSRHGRRATPPGRTHPGTRSGLVLRTRKITKIPWITRPGCHRCTYQSIRVWKARLWYGG